VLHVINVQHVNLLLWCPIQFTEIAAKMYIHWSWEFFVA